VVNVADRPELMDFPYDFRKVGGNRPSSKA